MKIIIQQIICNSKTTLHTGTAAATLYMINCRFIQHHIFTLSISHCDFMVYDHRSLSLVKSLRLLMLLGFVL